MSPAARKWFRWSAFVIGLVLLLLLVYRVMIWAGFESWSVRKLRFASAAQKAEGLITAIKAYERDHGAAPESLSALVPRYIARIPGTGLANYPDFKYELFTNSYVALIWYDLGSRNGQPMAGLWCYPEGDAEHAILVLTIDQTGRVAEARVDRMPENHQTNAFDAKLWRLKERRIEMVRSLPQTLSLPGTDTNEVVTLLGRPEGSRILRNAPWELRINCSWGLLNWDVFFYWPTQQYPGYIYGGNVERIENWAYVHE